MLAVLAKLCIFIRPIGQAVKTSPFHGGNPGSIPGWVTRSPDLFFSRFGFFLTITGYEKWMFHVRKQGE